MVVKRKLLDLVRDKIRVKHYSYSTEKNYIFWIKQYIFYHDKKHPLEMGKPEIEQFLTHLDVEKKSFSNDTKSSFFGSTVSLQRGAGHRHAR